MHYAKNEILNAKLRVALYFFAIAMFIQKKAFATSRAERSEAKLRVVF